MIIGVDNKLKEIQSLISNLKTYSGNGHSWLTDFFFC